MCRILLKHTNTSLIDIILIRTYACTGAVSETGIPNISNIGKPLTHYVVTASGEIHDVTKGSVHLDQITAAVRAIVDCLVEVGRVERTRIIVQNISRNF